nr:MAG TPA: hypothetical protein [Caudoviricetes sp.]
MGPDIKLEIRNEKLEMFKCRMLNMKKTVALHSGTVLR